MKKGRDGTLTYRESVVRSGRKKVSKSQKKKKKNYKTYISHRNFVDNHYYSRMNAFNKIFNLVTNLWPNF